MTDRFGRPVNRVPVLEAIERTVSEFEDDHPELGEVEVSGVWVVGSRAVGEGATGSDTDITVEITPSKLGSDPMDTVEDIMDLHAEMFRELHPIVPGRPDVATIPSEELIDAVGWSSDTAREHVKRQQRHGGYSVYYDVLGDRMVEVEG